MVLLGGAFSWYWLSSRTTASDFDDGVAAYDRGAREAARMAFARAAKANPDDARAFVYLGRVSREDGNLSSARRFLDAAIRLSPSNGDANREMGALLLMQGDADVARRFYVRAVQANPSDKLAQGFLACALIRLGRPDEAKRWSERAGAGEWSACVDAHTVPPTAPPATSVSPTRPSP